MLKSGPKSELKREERGRHKLRCVEGQKRMRCGEDEGTPARGSDSQMFSKPV